MQQEHLSWLFNMKIIHMLMNLQKIVVFCLYIEHIF